MIAKSEMTEIRQSDADGTTFETTKNYRHIRSVAEGLELSKNTSTDAFNEIMGLRNTTLPRKYVRPFVETKNHNFICLVSRDPQRPRTISSNVCGERSAMT